MFGAALFSFCVGGNSLVEQHLFLIAEKTPLYELYILPRSAQIPESYTEISFVYLRPDVSTITDIYAHATRETKRTSARLLDKVAGEE